MIETQLLKLQLHQVELVSKIAEAEKVANMASTLDLMGPAGRRLYGAVKGLFEKVNTVVTQRTQLEEVSQSHFPQLPQNIHNKTRHCAHEAKEIYFSMKRRRASRTQSRDELASHMGQRQRLETHCQTLIALFADETFPIMKKRHVATQEWFRETTKHLRLIVNINFTTKSIGK